MKSVVGILLAAGSSCRFGRNKLLHHHEHGVPMGVAAARNLIAALPQSVAVVRPADTLLRDMLADEGLTVVVNRRASQGIGTSIACGVSAMPQARGWLVALGDMPHVRAATVRLIAERVMRGTQLVAPFYDGRRGHPVAFGRSFFAQLTALDRDRGARDILERHYARIDRVDTEDPGILLDVDVPENSSEN